jgi:hypothetical protein
MSRVDLYPAATAAPDEALLQTGTAIGSKVAADVNILNAIEGSVQFQGLRTQGKITHLSLTAGSWTALPASALSDRNSICIQNISGSSLVVIINYSVLAPSTEGFRIPDGGFKSMAITDGIQVYGRMLSGSGTVVVEELA